MAYSSAQMKKSGFFGAMMLLAASMTGAGKGAASLNGALRGRSRMSHTSSRVGPRGEMRRKPDELPYTKHFGTFSPLKPLAHLRG